MSESQATDRAAPAPDTVGRRAAMALLAQAHAAELRHGLAAVVDAPRYVELRPVATGLVMVRGRVGGDGAAFNLGEATVTRAAVRMESGEVGFSYLLGRDHDKARLAAVCDALWQGERRRDAIERHVLAPVRLRLERERAEKREQAAATRVDFFTLVRGED
jgi:alpha-D-ribose 1-methylphosphonate 5-triphosphate synthase subunit PhnG